MDKKMTVLLAINLLLENMASPGSQQIPNTELHNGTVFTIHVRDRTAYPQVFLPEKSPYKTVGKNAGHLLSMDW